MIERFIDYITASLWLSEEDIKRKELPQVSPVRFYKRGYRTSLGFRVYFGNPNTNKALIVASGSTMQDLRDSGLSDAEVLDWIMTRGGKVSRLDLAVTEWVSDDLVTLEDVKCWWRSGLVESSLTVGGAKGVFSVDTDGQESTETFYIGSLAKRGRKGIFRAYDKGIELDLGAYMVTRLELELKHGNAESTAKRLAETNDIAGNFRAKFNVKSDDFDRVMDADAVVLKRGKSAEKEEEEAADKRRWEWLIGQVAPSLKSAIASDRNAGLGDTNLLKFLQASGLLDEIRTGILANANKLHDNYLQSIGIKDGKFKSEDLD